MQVDGQVQVKGPPYDFRRIHSMLLSDIFKNLLYLDIDRSRNSGTAPSDTTIKVPSESSRADHPRQQIVTVPLLRVNR